MLLTVSVIFATETSRLWASIFFWPSFIRENQYWDLAKMRRFIFRKMKTAVTIIRGLLKWRSVTFLHDRFVRMFKVRQKKWQTKPTRKHCQLTFYWSVFSSTVVRATAVSPSRPHIKFISKLTAFKNQNYRYSPLSRLKSDNQKWTTKLRKVGFLAWRLGSMAEVGRTVVVKINDEVQLCQRAR